jgi:PAS domain S-box-containing protein
MADGEALLDRAGPPGPGPAGLLGPGQVAADLDAVDWAATPLGPRQHWPRSLQTTLRMMLANRFSMWMAWGPDLTFFCNDAYRRDTLAEKYPWALGRPAREVWSEIWPDIGPRIEQVIRTERATWDESLLLFLQRKGFVEESYHTFSYSPLHGDDEEVAGMLCVVAEETERVIGERRLTLLSRLSSVSPETGSESELVGLLAGHLAQDARAFPFALVYLTDDEPAGPIRLSCAVGLEDRHPLAQAELAADGSWHGVRWAAGGPPVVLPDLRERFTDLPTGAWDDPPTHAVLTPLPGAGQDRSLGLLVTGVNPYRPMDDELLAFVELVAGQLAAQVAAARAYAAERRRAERLAELDQAKTTFFTNVSHEFRTPLTLMLGPAEDVLAEPAGTLPAVQRERVEVIHRNAQRLLKLVNTLLDFSRLEAGRATARYEPVDLAGYTRDLASMFRSAVERAGLTLTVDCPPLPEPVHVDLEMWAKVVLNLLSNALKFTFTGGITVRLEAVDDQVVLAVSDTGIGIDPAEQPRLFERFHRTTSTRARTHEGSGIGLALVAELAELHGGTVSVTSEREVGSTFTVSVRRGAGHLPPDQVRRDGDGLDDDGAVQQPVTRAVQQHALGFLAEADRWMEGAEQGAEGGTGPGASGAGAGTDVLPGPRRRVLVVDDNADMRRYVAALLTPRFRVSTAPDGAVALALAEADPPDLVLTDVMMPNLDGFGLLAALRGRERTSGVPVVMLSARSGEEAAIEGLQAGADDYLAKPFSAQELLARVTANLRLAELRNAEAAWRRALVESMQDAFFISSADGVLLEVNDAFRDLVGHPVRTPMAAPFPWTDDGALDPAGKARVEAEVARVRQDGHGTATGPLRHADGRRRWVEAMISSLTDPRSGELVYVSTLRDVTASVVEAEQQAALHRMASRLTDAEGLDEVLTVALDELTDLFGADRGVVALVDRDELTRVIGTQGPPGPAASAALRAVATSTVAVESHNDPLTGTGLGLPVESEALVAAFWLEFDRPQAFSADARAELSRLSDAVSHAMRRAQGYDRQRTVALTLQRSILGPVDLPRGFAVRYQPAERPLEVGGDWYDVVQLGGSLVGVVVGDCVGKGLPAAAVMGQLRSACRALLLQAKGPAEALVALDDFARLIPDAACTTVFCAIIDQATGEVRYSAAGHPPAILAGPDGAAGLLDQARSVPLASLPAWQRPEATVRMAPGSTLLLYTDGLVERRRTHFDAGIARTIEALREAGDVGEDQLAEHLLRSVLSGEQMDDAALLVYRHVEPTRLQVSVAADPAQLSALRRRLRSWLGEAGMADLDVDAVLIAVGEACANAIEHGYRFSAHETVELVATIEAGQLLVEVRDRGRWKPPEHNPGRGRGRTLMARLMDETRIEPGPDGTVVRMRKDLSHAG